MYNKIETIWKKEISEAIQTIIKRKKTESAEDILFQNWSDTIQKIFSITGEEEIWKAANKKEKIEAFAGKTLSFQNFQNEVIEKIN